MKNQFFRPTVSLLVVAAILSALYITARKYDPAHLETHALQGQAEAQYRLGKAYFSGFVVGKNYQASATWLAKAAAQGHLKAQAGLALMYEKGFGVRQDYAEAARLYRVAADQGLALAQNQLGVFYAQGKGVPRDIDEAIKWFGKSAEQGCKTARQNLALTLQVRCGKTFSLSAGGKVYSAVTVLKVEADGLMVAFEPEPGALGFAKIHFSDLPADLQQRYGYDSSKQAIDEAGLTRLSSL